MEILDITRELLSAPVYPGDPAPVLKPLQRMALGDSCNVTALQCCLHNGTHMDAPLHFVEKGSDIVGVSLETCIGPCRVVEQHGVLSAEQARACVEKPCERLLLKGQVTIGTGTAAVLAEAGVRLIGVEPQSVAAAEHTVEVHSELLDCGILLLEGLKLSHVAAGEYFLFAAPMKIAGSEGAPVRAVLIKN